MRDVRVAPFAGAWIETRGTELMNGLPLVAPFAGAWIETLIGEFLISAPRVAPFAGAWIETSLSDPDTSPIEGRALRGRVD